MCVILCGVCGEWTHSSLTKNSGPSFSAMGDFMRMAIGMAEEALRVGEVPIGCVIVDGDAAVVAKGRNRTNESRNATRHAEFEALDQILATLPPETRLCLDPVRNVMSRCTLYVTVEPCIMCAAALRRVGLTTVYFGCYNERFGGCGSIIPVHTDYIAPSVDPQLRITLLKEHRKECVGLLRQFYIRENERAPVPRKKAKRVLKPLED